MVRYTCACRRKFRKRHVFYILFVLTLTILVHMEFRGSTTDNTPRNDIESLLHSFDHVGNTSLLDIKNGVALNETKVVVEEAKPGAFLENKSVVLTRNIQEFEDTKPNNSYYSTKSVKAVVPNIVHLVWLGKEKPMSFVNYISIVSVYKHQNPIAIVLHYNYLPIGYWFAQLRSHVPKLKTRFSKPPTHMSGKSVTSIADQITIMALDILLKHGGIYMENDVIVLRKLDPLRHQIVTIGESKTRTRISAAFIVAEPNATFIHKWYDSYQYEYRPSQEGYNRVVLPRRLCDRYPRLVHLDKWRLTTPEASGYARLVQKHLNWDSLFIFHLMSRKFSYSFFTPDWIKQQNCTLAEVSRLVYYGSTDLVTV